MKCTLIVSFLIVVAIFSSCKKEATPAIEKVEINVTLAPGSEFRYELKPHIKNKEFPLITKAPNNYNVSKIIYSDTTIGPVYQYISTLSATGSDKVIIKIIREHDHDPLAIDDHRENDDYTSVIITLNFLFR